VEQVHAVRDRRVNDPVKLIGKYDPRVSYVERKRNAAFPGEARLRTSQKLGFASPSFH